MTRKTHRTAAAARRTPIASEPRPAEPRPAPGFAPAPTRARADGWTPARQVAFVDALGECGCVEEACGRVGMSTTSAYQLRRRADAASFREAWDLALDYAIRRLSDAAFARALNGVATPVFYKGEQIGERRRYDEKLTMFLLRYRDPTRYGSWIDGREARRHPDGAARLLDVARGQVAEDAVTRANGRTPPVRAPITAVRHVGEAEQEVAEQEAANEAARAAEEREEAAREAEWNRYLEEDAALDRVAAVPAARPARRATAASVSVPSEAMPDDYDPDDDYDFTEDDRIDAESAADHAGNAGDDGAEDVSGADVSPTSPTSGARSPPRPGWP